LLIALQNNDTDLRNDSLEVIAKVDKEISEYLEEHFRVATNAGDPLKLKWLSREFDLQSKSHLWLHFWVDLSNTESVIVTNRILLDGHHRDEQVNRLTVFNGTRKSELCFTSMTPTLVAEIPK
jgi:hypothetical protein